MRTSIRSSTRGRANKVTKPKSRSGGRLSSSSVPHDAVEHLTLAAAQAQANQHHHYSQHPGQDQDNTDLDAPHDSNGNAHDLVHHHPSPDEGQLAAQGFVPNGPGQDPSIHPALQGLGNVSHHAEFASSLDHHHHHQQQMDEHMQQTAAAATAASDIKTAEQMVRQSGYDKVDLENAASALSKRLMTQPGRRLARQRRAEQNLNLVRRSNVEALLAHVSGQQAASACKNCHKGHGPWTECVIVEGQMCGSCANCWYNASGARCSFHETNNPQAHQPSILPAGTQAAANSNFGLPTLAPAGVGVGVGVGVQARQMPMMPVQIPLEAGSPGRIIAEQAMAEVLNAQSPGELLRLQIETQARQLMLSMLDLNRLQAAEAQGTGQGHGGQGQNMSQMSATGPQSVSVPDAAMDEGDDEGT